MPKEMEQTKEVDGILRLESVLMFNQQSGLLLLVRVRPTARLLATTQWSVTGYGSSPLGTLIFMGVSTGMLLCVLSDDKRLHIVPSILFWSTLPLYSALKVGDSP